MSDSDIDYIENSADRYMPVTLDGETFGALVGRESQDVYLFRVSEPWVDAMGDGEWHGPVEWRIVREEGRIVTLEMREVKRMEMQT